MRQDGSLVAGQKRQDTGTRTPAQHSPPPGSPATPAPSFHCWELPVGHTCSGGRRCRGAFISPGVQLGHRPSLRAVRSVLRWADRSGSTSQKKDPLTFLRPVAGPLSSGNEWLVPKRKGRSLGQCPSLAHGPTTL